VVGRAYSPVGRGFGEGTAARRLMNASGQNSDRSLVIEWRYLTYQCPETDIPSPPRSAPANDVPAQ
jgi:hypothetical protein